MQGQKRMVALVGAFALCAGAAFTQTPTVIVTKHKAQISRSDYNRACKRRKAHGAEAGTILGGATGSVIGGAMMAGPIGAGVGLVAGHEIGRREAHCRLLADSKAPSHKHRDKQLAENR